jgi:hypothetical protein
LGVLGVKWENNIGMDIKNCDMSIWTVFMWLKIEPSVGSCEHDNETSGSIKGE